MQNVIVGYARNQENDPFGCFVGKLVGDTVVIGVSVCNENADRFNKERGRKIAEGRITAGRSSGRRAIASVNSDLKRFKNRCERYFQTDKIMVI